MITNEGIQARADEDRKLWNDQLAQEAEAEIDDSEKDITESIAGYLVNLCVYNEDGEPRSYCHIKNQDETACSSIEAARHTGELEAHHVLEDNVPISLRSVELIEEWAYKNGY